MNRIHVKGNTWALEGKQLIGYYQVDEKSCILLDAGKENERADIENTLAEAGLSPVGLILSHMHYDHNENSRYFREKFGIPVAMPRGEAEICRNEATLKNHLFCFTPGLISQYPRLQNLICPVDRPIEMDETQIDFQGATFEILHTPGHSPDHCSIVTPDGVCYLGDAIMCGQDLARSQIPFVFGVALDLETKKAMRGYSYDRYIVPHYGILEELLPVLEENISLIERQAAYMGSLITKPTTFCDCYAVIMEALEQASVHPIWNLHMERYLRPYIEYLIDTGVLTLAAGNGAPTVAPRGWQE